MFDWNGIDLHFHTKSGYDRKKKNDEIDFDYLRFVSALTSKNIKLAAATNHNFIFFAQYVVIKYLLSKVNINYLMGVEIDTNKGFANNVNDDSNKRHIVLIFKDSFTDNYNVANIVNKLTMSKINNEEIFFTSDDIFNEIIIDRDVIIIPHGDKDKGYLRRPVKEELEDFFRKKDKGFIRVADQKTDWEMSKLKEAILKNMNKNINDRIFSALFTDTRKWDNYDYRGFVINAEPTYEGFAQATFNPKYRFGVISEITEPPNYISRIEIIRNTNSNSKAIKPTTLHLSPRYNCVIGKSGSGKSLLSYLIKRTLTNEETIKNLYSFSDDFTIKVYNNSNLRLDSSNFICTNGINIFQQIIKVMDGENANITNIAKIFKKSFEERKSIDDYIKKYNEHLSDYCKLSKHYSDGILKLNELFISFADNVAIYVANEEHIALKVDVLKNNYIFTKDDDPSYQMSFDNYTKSLKEELDKYKAFTNYYDELSSLIDVLTKGFEAIRSKVNLYTKSNNLSHLKISLFNAALSNVNGNVSLRAQKAVEASDSIKTNSTAISKSVVQLYLEKRRIENFDLSLDFSNIEYTETLNEELKIVIKEYLDTKYLKEFDPQRNCLFKIHGFTTKIRKGLYDLSKKVDAKKMIDDYLEVGVLDSDKENQFAYDETKLKEIFRQEMTINKENILQLNPGTLAKTYIKYYFGTELLKNERRPNLVIFDQIENDVDKEYISDEIKNYIQSLKGSIQLLIITHDPIVAVNADPNNYILAKKDSGGISYKNFVIENNEVESLHDISKTVDGSINVLKNRYFIYERGDNDEDSVV